MNEDFLVSPGGALKSLSDTGKIGGYLVLYGPENVDLQDEYFSPNCDFWLEGKTLLPLIFDHGRSQTFKRKKITHVRVEPQSQGIWIEGRLPLHESPKIEDLWEAIQRDELGLSSGSSGHLVERVMKGRVAEITAWPISEASLAPVPAQPKSRAVALKSLPAAEFETLSPEQRALSEYVKLLQWQHETRMREIVQSGVERV
jgi:hypothetical protein